MITIKFERMTNPTWRSWLLSVGRHHMDVTLSPQNESCVINIKDDVARRFANMHRDSWPRDPSTGFDGGPIIRRVLWAATTLSVVPAIGLIDKDTDDLFRCDTAIVKHTSD